MFSDHSHDLSPNMHLFLSNHPSHLLRPLPPPPPSHLPCLVAVQGHRSCIVLHLEVLHRPKPILRYMILYIAIAGVSGHSIGNYQDSGMKSPLQHGLLGDSCVFALPWTPGS